jgi:hypothetical protein
MSNKSKPATVRTKSARESAKPASKGPGRPAGRGKKGVAFDIGSLVSEVRDLRTLRDRYQTLLHEHNGLLGTLKDLSAELGTSARKAWSNYRGGATTPEAGAASTFRTRVRTSSQLVDTQYDKFVETLPSGWTSKEDICKAAGLDPRGANTAFRRLVTGFKRDGKNTPPRLESNGKRGTEGRYRKK